MMNVSVGLSKSAQKHNDGWYLSLNMNYDAFRDCFWLEIIGMQNYEVQLGTPARPTITFVFEGQFCVPCSDTATRVSRAMQDCSRTLFDKIRFTVRIQPNQHEFCCSEILKFNGMPANWERSASNFIYTAKSLYMKNEGLRAQLSALYKFGTMCGKEAMYWDLKETLLIDQSIAFQLWNKYNTWTGFKIKAWEIQQHPKLKQITNNVIGKDMHKCQWQCVTRGWLRCENLEEDDIDKILQFCLINGVQLECQSNCSGGYKSL